jgi:hypothetical protein
MPAWMRALATFLVLLFQFFCVKASSYFYIASGSCTVVGDCFRSPNYPSDYSSSSDCEIGVFQTVLLNVKSFLTESCCDDLIVNGVDYSGSVGPNLVTTSSPIYWDADSSVVKSGFEICNRPDPSIAPSPEPTLRPSQIPTYIPSPAPTPLCGTGHYLDDASHQCLACEVGRFANHTSDPPYPNNCTLCGPGEFTATEGSSSCSLCSGGLSNEERTECRACIPGEYAFDNIECVRCSSGQYAPTAQVGSCLVCQAGDHTNNVTGATACTSCQAGTYSQALSTFCSKCLAGEYSRERAASCLLCEPGTYSSSTGSTTCTDCTAGTAAPNPASSFCTICPEGKAAGLTGLASCTDCLKGTFSALEGQILCLECPAGRKSHSPGLSNCSICPPGKNQEKTGSDDCLDCPSGKFAESPGSLTCAACPLTYSSHVAAPSCNLAEKGFAIDPITGKSHACSGATAECPGGRILPIPKRGFWVDRSDVKYSRFVYECARGTCTGAPSEASAEAAATDSNMNTTAATASFCWSPSSPSYQSDGLMSSTTTSYSSSGSGVAGLEESLDSSAGETKTLDACDSDQLQCLKGSTGHLCGACVSGFTYSSALAICVACESGQNIGPAVGALVLMGLALCVGLFYWLVGWRPPPWVFELALVRLLSKIDGGMLKVM